MGKKTERHGERLNLPGKHLLHQLWRASVVVVIFTGLLHLLNLVGFGRLEAGPILLTPFRVSFFTSWLLLLYGLVSERRFPRLDRADLLVAVLVVAFLLRGLFAPETLGLTINWLLTGAGVFLLIKHGIRDASDVRLVLVAIVGATLVLSLYGMVEYLFKTNPLFDSIQIDVIGMDMRVAASSQFYRIRSLIAHPGFVGAIVLGAMPLTVLIFWQRRALMFVSLVLLGLTLFFTFSRGSWFIGVLVLVPPFFIRARYWARHHLRWIIPLTLVPLMLLVFDYWGRDELWAELGSQIRDNGLHWIKGNDGPVVVTSGQAYGVQPYNKFIYFDVDDSFYRGNQGPVTVTVHFFDKGAGAVRVDYDGMDDSVGKENGAYTATPSINKTNSQEWTTAAFYLEQPRFEGRQNQAADFRIVDDDSIFTVDRVTITKGRLKLPSVVVQQWLSRSTSFDNRISLYPFAWEVLKEYPLGVGLHNTPESDHHAADSLPLTWMMEFGWPGLILLGGLLLVFAYEGIRAWRDPRGPAVVLLFSLVIILMHGGHLMILYDKPSLVMTAALAGVYAQIRPWRRGGAIVEVSNKSCMV
ncbi:MAG: hypothetical protein WC935_01235 [Thermoleophilia bacterium]